MILFCWSSLIYFFFICESSSSLTDVVVDEEDDSLWLLADWVFVSFNECSINVLFNSGFGDDSVNSGNSVTNYFWWQRKSKNIWMSIYVSTGMECNLHLRDTFYSIAPVVTPGHHTRASGTHSWCSYTWLWQPYDSFSVSINISHILNAILKLSFVW